MQHKNSWERRISHPSASCVSLDVPSELWLWERSRYEGADAVAAAVAACRGHMPDDETVVDRVVRSLLRDVVHAAGSVEYTFSRWTAVLEEMTSVLSAWQLPSIRADTTHFSHPTIDAAWYELHSLLVWVRTLGERLKRPSKLPGFPDQGLIPALAIPELRSEVTEARSRFLQNGGHDARWLANLWLHSDPIHRGSPLAVQDTDGGFVLPFPDAVSSTVWDHTLLTYTQSRSAESVARTMFDATCRLMEETIAAFEANVPERMRSTT